MRPKVPFALAIVLVLTLSQGSDAQDGRQGPTDPLLTLLQSGRVPEERLGPLVKLLCGRGDSDALRYLLDEVLRDDHWPEPLRVQTLSGLAEATRNRGIVPTGSLSRLNELLSASSPALRSGGVQLAGLWKVAECVPHLREQAQQGSKPIAERQEALRALSLIDPTAARKMLERLCESSEPPEVRSMSVAVLASLDPALAARWASEVAGEAHQQEEIAPLLDAFLSLRTGPGILAAALRENPPDTDRARLLLRHLYSAGRSDEELVRPLTEWAGIKDGHAVPGPEEIGRLVRLVAVQGDPERGEGVFRREDLSCLKCHSVSQAGGQVGPDLSAVGSISPSEFLLTSILNPDQAVKEAYLSRRVMTESGHIHQGILVSRNSDSLVLRLATGGTISIPVAEIEQEVDGGSLMPRGLTNLMTEGELVDLVAFLSHLGRPGPYAVRTTARLQRYRWLPHPPEQLLQDHPPAGLVADVVQRPEAWRPVYARVNGELPLDELPSSSDDPSLFVYGEVLCTEGGPAEIHFDSVEGLSAWLDDEELAVANPLAVELVPGNHRLVIRIDRRARSAPTIHVELRRPPNSSAQFTVVDGS